LKKNIFPRTIKDLDLHLNRCLQCGTAFIICGRVTYDKNTNTITSHKITPLPLFCSSYFCQHCKDLKVKILFKKIFCGLKNETWRFATFTTNRTFHSDEDNLNIINHAWNKMLTVLRKRFHDFKFIKVLEISDSGFVHLHVLFNIWIPQEFLRHHWEKYTGAFIVNIERPKNLRSSAAYIAKYISKNCNDFSNLKKFFLNRKRKFSFSRNWNFRFKKIKNYILLSANIFNSDKLTFFILSALQENFYSLDEFCFEKIPPDVKALIVDSYTAERD